MQKKREETRITILGLPMSIGVSIETLCEAIDSNEPTFVTFINPLSWHIAKINPDYRGMLDDMTLVLPDGYGVVAACNILTNNKCSRISFDMSSAAGAFFKRLEESEKSLFLVGGSAGVAEHTARKLKENYPELHIIGSINGFCEMGTIVAKVKELNPDSVIVGMGAPAQERAIAALREAGYRGLAVSCGGFFDQYIERVKYYPYFVDKLNIRFLYRLYKEPRRLWRRYTINYMSFILLFVQNVLLRMLSRHAG